MWRPEIAGWSITTSQSGWRPTTLTGFSSWTSETIAPSRLITMRAPMGSEFLPVLVVGCRERGLAARGRRARERGLRCGQRRGSGASLPLGLRGGLALERGCVHHALVDLELRHGAGEA